MKGTTVKNTTDNMAKPYGKWGFEFFSFWDVVLHHLIIDVQHFETEWCSHFQETKCSSLDILTLDDENTTPSQNHHTISKH
jgi:hypothetical protein